MNSLKLTHNILTLAIVIGFILLVIYCCKHGCDTFYKSLPKVKAKAKIEHL